MESVTDDEDDGVHVMPASPPPPRAAPAPAQPPPQDHDDADNAALLAQLARMRGLGAVGERVLEETELAPRASSPLLPRPGAAAAPPRALGRVPATWTHHVLAPVTISAAALWAHTEQQRAAPSQGGLGMWSRLLPSSPAFQQMLEHARRKEVLPLLDLYAEQRDAGAADEPPTPRRLSLALQARGGRSGTVWERTVISADRPCVVGALGLARPRDVLLLMDHVTWPCVLPATALVPVEVQLQQLALSALFHVALWVDDTPEVDAHLARLDQWSHTLLGYTTSAQWQAQAGLPLLRVLQGSKHECGSAPGMRLWRVCWRRRPRPAPPAASVVLVDYVVAPHPHMERAGRGPHEGAAAAAEDDTRALAGQTFAQTPESVLAVLGLREQLVVTHEQSAVRLLDATSRREVRALPLAAKRVRTSGVQLYAALADEPPRIVVYDMINANVAPVTLAPPHVIPTDFVVRPVGALGQMWVIAVGTDREVHVWNAPHGRGGGGDAPWPPHASLQGHTDQVTCVEVGRDVLYSGGCDAVVCVWDVTTFRLLHLLRGHTDWIFSLLYVPPSDTLLSCSRDASVRVWRGADCIRVLGTGGSRALAALALAPPLVAVTTGNNCVVLLDMTLEGAKAVVGTCKGHAGRITQVLLHPSGLLISASVDHAVRVWDRGTCVATFRGHTDAVNALHLQTPTQLLSASDDGTLRLWLLDPVLEAVEREKQLSPKRKIFSGGGGSGRKASPLSSLFK